MSRVHRARAASSPGLVAVACALLVGCEPPPPPSPPPNVVVVLVDTLRADHTSLLGYPRATTPHLARIAAEGLVMTRHYANASWTKPSVASIFTGLHPSAHGSRLGQFESLELIDEMRAAGEVPQVEVLSPKLDTMAELLAAHGWDTKAFLANPHMTPKFGYDQGYREYELVVGTWDDAAIMRDCIDAVPGPDRPVFVWCHLMATHQYDAPPEFPHFPFEPRTPIDRTLPQSWKLNHLQTVEGAVATYDRGIAFDDSLIGQLWDHLRAKAPNTILIVTSDHGEEFAEHGGFEHGRTLYDEVLHVPLVMWGPGVPRGVRVDGITDSIDLLPTVLALVGIESKETLPGRALVRDGMATGGKNESFAQEHHRARRSSLVRGGLKMIVTENPNGGGETVEVYAGKLGPERPGSAGEVPARQLDVLRRRLDQREADAQDYFRRRVGNSDYGRLDDHDVENLRALGYVE